MDVTIKMTIPSLGSACVLISLFALTAMADPAPSCQAFVVKSAATPSALSALTAKGYAVDSGGEVPSAVQMIDHYDITVAKDVNHQLAYWLKIPHHGYAVRGGLVLNADLSDLPACDQIPRYVLWNHFRHTMGDEARRRLDTFYSTGRLQPGMGEMILKAESILLYGLQENDAKLGENKQRYANLVRVVRRAWDQSAETDVVKRINDVRKVLHPYYQHYAKEFTMVSLLLQDDGFGNCQANTQLILATLIDAQIDLGPRFTLGAQLYIDHIQPVLIDREKNLYYDMIAGEQTSLEAPIYSPELITYALARQAGGRALVSERDISLIVRDMPFANMDFIEAFKYYVLERREMPYGAMGQFYLRWDRAFSYAGKPDGSDVPEFAEIDYADMDENSKPHRHNFGSELKAMSAEAMSDLLESMEDLAQEVGVDSKFLRAQMDKLMTKAGQTPDKKMSGRATGGWNLPFAAPAPAPVDSQPPLNYGLPSGPDLKEISDRVWKNVRPNLRPTEEDQLSLTRSGFYMEINQQSRVETRTLTIRAPINLGPATLSELQLIPDDMNFAILPPAPNSMASESVRTKVGDVQIKRPMFQIIIRPELAGVSAIKKAFVDKQGFSQWFEAEYEKSVRGRLNGIDQLPLKSWFKDEESISRISPDQRETLRRVFMDLNNLHEIVDEGTYFQIVPDSLRVKFDTKGVCDLAQAMANINGRIRNNPEMIAKWLDQLDQDSRQQFFAMMKVWEKAILPFERHLECFASMQSEMTAGIRNPLDHVFGWFVLKSLDQPNLKVVPPQIVSHVFLVETMETVPPPPKGLRGAQTVFGNRTEEVPETQAQKSGQTDDLKIRTEVLYGMLASISVTESLDPLIQLVSARLWTAEGERYFQTEWGQSPDAIENFMALWQWSPLLAVKDWMLGPIGPLYDEVASHASRVAHVNSKCRDSWVPMPEFVLADYQKLASQRGVPVELAKSMPENRIVSRESLPAADFEKVDFRIRNMVTESSSYPYPFSDAEIDQLKVAKSLPRNLVTLDWSENQSCRVKMNQAKFDESPTEVQSFYFGDAQTQTVHSVKIEVTSAADSPSSLKLVISKKDQSVVEALDNSKSAEK